MKPTKRDLKVSKIDLYFKQVARPAQKGGLDSNDRRYDRNVERELRNIKPQDLDALLNDSEE